VVKIARRKKFRYRYYRTKAKTAYRKIGGSRGGFKPYIDGIIGGVAAEAGQKFLGAWGAPVGIGAAGYLMKNSTLKTIAGLHIGSMLGDMLPVIGGNGSALGGVY